MINLIYLSFESYFARLKRVNCYRVNSLQHFSGNDDSRTIHTNYFKKNIVAKRIRIHPKSWIGWVSMRVELLGCLTGNDYNVLLFEACMLDIFTAVLCF